MVCCMLKLEKYARCEPGEKDNKSIVIDVTDLKGRLRQCGSQDGEVDRVLMSQANGSKWVLQVEPLYFFLFSESIFNSNCYWAFLNTGA